LVDWVLNPFEHLSKEAAALALTLEENDPKVLKSDWSW
jgi:hypothetical protein